MGHQLRAAEAFAKKRHSRREPGARDHAQRRVPDGRARCEKGRPAKDVLAEIVPREVGGLYWPKAMYWRGKAAERFVRPVRGWWHCSKTT